MHRFYAMRPASLSLIACLLCATASSADAQLYKWVDENGGVNYGDWPPSGVKLQPMNQGTVSSVADRALAPPPSRAANASRGAPRTDPSGVAVRNEASPPTASSSAGDADVVGAYAPYYGYPQRPAAAVAEAERRPAGAAVTRPMLPIDPAIPDMAWRPRR